MSIPYAITVDAPEALTVPDYDISFDPGRNTFTISLDDVDTFQAVLTGLGCVIQRTDRLDDPVTW